MYTLAADAILLGHFLFVAFVLLGQACIVIGCFGDWRWVRGMAFRVCHLLAIGIVVAQAWASRVCPLTRWENALRHAAEQQPYAGTFIEHWVGRLVYFDAPQWVFTAAYTSFGALVLFSWFWVRPQTRTASKAKAPRA